MANLRFSRALCSTLISACLLASTISPAAAQDRENDGPEDAVDAPLVGYITAAEPLDDESWIDPVVRFDLDPDALAPLPDFDVAEFHDSTVFAAGVDRIPTEPDELEEPELEEYVKRHRQVLQAIDTLELSMEENAREMATRRPRVDRLIDQIDHERAEQARLADEIQLRVDAITEYAVRTFINEGELDTALDTPGAGPSQIRVVSDQVREDQLRQIDEREAEIERRKTRQAGLEDELRLLRSELRLLRNDRSEIIAHRRDAEGLLPRTAASYQVALHDRLPLFVDNTDIPLVALNAYVIAERRLAEESPTCQIEWWMLAGIGKIESFHGHFGESTLNVNGHTTELIRGPALDGRILSGAELLLDGATAPEATNRTESQAVVPAEAPSESSPDPAPEAVASTEGADPASTDSTDPADGPADAPAPVIKRLALIVDSDGGELDEDTTYDRAVGPMQFIPQTWRLYEADGNLDEQSDPQNIYDAALASARYLCAATGSMATPEGRELAFFAYNHDDVYSAAVEQTGLQYREIISIPDDEFGTALPLGIADPASQDLANTATEDIKAIDVAGLLDW